MATEVIDETLEAKIAAMVKEMRGARLDTTGKGVEVPEGFDICVFAKDTKPYRKAGHVVEYVGDPSVENAVAFIKFGEPAEVARNVCRKQLHTKPGDAACPSNWQRLLGDLVLPSFSGIGLPKPGDPQEA